MNVLVYVVKYLFLYCYHELISLLFFSLIKKNRQFAKSHKQKPAKLTLTSVNAAGFKYTINVAGNKTTALAVKSKKVTITDNIINALGDNLGNSTSFSYVNTSGLLICNMHTTREYLLANIFTIGFTSNQQNYVHGSHSLCSW